MPGRTTMPFSVTYYRTDNPAFIAAVDELCRLTRSTGRSALIDLALADLAARHGVPLPPRAPAVGTNKHTRAGGLAGGTPRPERRSEVTGRTRAGRPKGAGVRRKRETDGGDVNDPA